MLWKITIIAFAWSILLVFWVAAIFVFKRTTPAKRNKDWRLFIGLISIITILILSFSVDYLVIRLELQFPYNYLINLIGIILLFSGLSFALWARTTLASFWSSAPVIIENQPLTRDGPYAIVRHPIYTGIIAMLWGSFFMGEFLSLLFSAFLGMVFLYWKAKFEEAMLIKYKGDEYFAYMKKVPGLLPFFISEQD